MWNNGLEQWNTKGSLLCSSADEMIAYGKDLASLMTESMTVALYGELGSGKTTLAKGIISSLTGTSEHDVTSPTFQYVHLYEGLERHIAHFDLWRLERKESFVASGFDELCVDLALIEWPERIRELLPRDTMVIVIEVMGEGRQVTVYPQLEMSGR